MGEQGRKYRFSGIEEFKTQINEALSFCDQNKIPYNLPEILAYLGICQRTWDRYCNNDGYYKTFNSTAKKVMTRIEAAIVRLMLKNIAGQIFYAKNKHGYKDKQEIEHDVTDKTASFIMNIGRNQTPNTDNGK